MATTRTPGIREHQVALAQLGNRHFVDSLVGAFAPNPRRLVGQQFGKLAKRAPRLRDGAHFEPMTEQHDGHECRKLLPQRLARITERHRGAEEERNTDRERDQRHHSGQSIAKLAHRAGYERPAAICEHCGAEDRGDPHRARQRGRRVSDQRRQHVSPDQDGDRQRERNPELPTKHRRAVTGMPVVRAFVAFIEGILAPGDDPR